MTRLPALLVLALMVYAALPPRVAEAAPLCSSLHHTPCAKRFSFTTCDLEGTEQQCVCDSAGWECPI